MSRLANLRVLVTIFFTALSFLTIASDAFATDCLKDHREMVLGRDDNGRESVVRVREYLCKSPTRRDEFVRVQFHRLSDAAAHSLLSNSIRGPLGSVFGLYSLTNNRVAEEYRTLLSKFGNDTYEGIYATLGIDTPIGGVGTSEKLALSQQYSNNSRSPVTLPLTSDIPMIDDLIHIRDQQNWPDGYKFFYSSQSDNLNAILSTNLWRFATARDLAQYGQNVSRMTRLVGKEDASYLHSKYLELIKHVIGNQTLPADFLIITADANACGDSFSFSIGGREFLLDVITVENNTHAIVNLDALLGQEIPGKSLRVIDRSPTADNPATDTVRQGHKIMPGEKVVIPIRIFARSALNSWFWRDDSNEAKAVEQSKQTYEKIKNRASDHIFSVGTTFYGLGRERRAIRKAAKSFAPPTTPSAPNYAIGPEIKVAGLIVDGERMLLEGTSANFLNLTVSSGAGSCPILYFREESVSDWRRYGKVIHQARGESNETTQQVRLPGLVLKYRLVEEELEVAHINRIRLSLELKSGETRSIIRDDTNPKSRDQKYSLLFAGDKLDTQFDLPADIHPDDVTSSIVEVSGYYERYASIIAQAR